MAEEKEIKNREEKKVEEKPENTQQKVEKKETEKPKQEEKAKVEEKKEKEIPKKTEAKVRGLDLRMSTKKSVALCNLIRNKKIEDALKKVEEVIKMKRAVKIKGEYAHKKGMASGIYPLNAAKILHKLLKALHANSINNGLEIEKTIISIAKADIASRPFRSGNRKAKRTHVLLVAKEKNKEKNNK